MLQAVEIPIEQLVSGGVDEAGVVLQHRPDALHGFAAVSEELIQEGQDLLHVGQLLLGGAGSDTVAHKDQQGLFNRKLPQCRASFRKEVHLLIEGEQAAGEVQILGLPVDAAAEIVDPIILAVAVVVEVLVGIVHQNGLSVFLHQGTLFPGLGGVALGIGVQCLLEGGGILEGEAFL